MTAWAWPGLSFVSIKGSGITTRCAGMVSCQRRSCSTGSIFRLELFGGRASPTWGDSCVPPFPRWIVSGSGWQLTGSRFGDMAWREGCLSRAGRAQPSTVTVFLLDGCRLQPVLTWRCLFCRLTNSAMDLSWNAAFLYTRTVDSRCKSWTRPKTAQAARALPWLHEI